MEKFIVSARKYRPITFESVVGQGHITSTLRNAIARDQVAHAYLFCGPRGVGKTTCARILSKSLNCLTPVDGVEPCGVCESCKAFEENRSFNIHELDAASNNSVENIRALNDQVRIAPQIGKYSVYIIDEAHMLSTAAFNAFLKTLEEPPAHAIFILATTEKHKILPTILSRCQIYDFKRIKVEDMVRFLAHISQMEQITYDDESLHIISQKADGCMRDALSMFDKVVSFCGSNLQFKEVAEALNVLDYDSYFTFVESYKSGDYRSALLQFDEVLQKGFDSMTFLAGLSSHLRDLLVAADSSTISLLEVTGTIAKRFSEQSASTPISLIFDSLNIISQAESNARFSLNLRLSTELTILKLCNLSPLKLSQGSVDQKYTLPSVTGGAKVQNVASSAPVEVKNVVKEVSKEVEPKVEPKVESKVESKVEPKVAPKVEVSPTPKPVQPTSVAATSAATTKKGSLLGVSISSMIKESEEEELPQEKELVSCKDNESDLSMVIPADKIDGVLAGCKKYAEMLQQNRPRLASSFEYCKIEDGVLKITVANNIIKDEINTNRHSITEELMPLCKIRPLYFEVLVDEAIENDKIVLLKDEDKLKFMMEQNGSLSKFCQSLHLDYI